MYLEKNSVPEKKNAVFFCFFMALSSKLCIFAGVKALLVMQNDSYANEIRAAVEYFWKKKNAQRTASGDTSNRGAVTGGKQLDGFLRLLVKVALDAGVPERCIYTKNSYLPGFFRSSKDWDFLVISPSRKLIATIELKSQVGSYGNNFNNRTEEAIGSAVDLWTAFRENQFPGQQAPWVGYMMIIGKDAKSVREVHNSAPHFPVRPEFEGASYIDRYRLLCQKLIQERHYTAAALLATGSMYDYEDVAEGIAIHNFLSSFAGHLKGQAHEFE